jgi:formate hydrogenlyase transcriptional activator
MTERQHAEEALERVRDERKDRLKTPMADPASANEPIVLSEQSLEERLRFETLLSDLSARFMASPLDQVDGEIDNALRRIMEFFQVDRCGLLEVQKEKAFAKITHAAFGEGLEPISGEINVAELFPWSYQQLRQGKHINICRVGDYPEEARRDRQSHAAMGIKSALNIPVAVGGRILRTIVITSTREHQTWPEAYIPRLRLLGEIFVNALERREGKLKLEERLRFETLLSEISARFVNLPADRMDSEIGDAQRRICEFLDLDRSTLFQVPEREPGTLLLTNVHQPPEGPPPPERLNAGDLYPWTAQKLLDRETVTISKMTDLPPEAGRDRESFLGFGTKSGVYVPLSVGEAPVFGVLGFAVMSEERSWPEMVVAGFKLIAQVFANALARRQADTERQQMEGQLRERLQEIEGLKERLESENIYLQEEIKLLVEHTEIVGQSLAMKRILAQAEQVARTDSTVLLLGETGTGKELMARAIHGLSLRKERPLVTVNCASLPPSLIESELFGREKGAYTGAMTRMIGRFEIADGSTLFLDEIGELPLDLQSKLLRVLEEGNFERLGSAKPLHVDVRIVAATNRDLAQEVKEGKFRPDLFYRLNVFPILIPPLRDRPEDIPLLVWAVVKEFQKRMGKEIESIPKRTMQALQAYSWPGNVRELRNVIEHAMILTRSRTLDIQVPKRASSERDASGHLEELERTHIASVLEKTGWRIGGQGGAAEILGLKRTTLLSKMKKLGLKQSSKVLSS